MPKVQCKMCGGELTLPENAQNGTCEYCGSRVTFPKIADEHQENLYARAEHFRQMNDYDKALRAYEQIVTASPDDAEAYWGLVLCRYGIEYVKDPATGERIPTCHRVSYDSILADADYLAALEHAGSVERGIYETEAKRIAEIQKGILAISAQEEPFDVFICYKESDDSGRRTRDSVAAQEIYYALTEQGYKVFFSRITLEKKLGQQYEPYIFAALNSAKAMLVIGSKPEYFNAVWVRNEWSRFLALMKKDRKKLLIPCYRDMDAYDIPEELSMFQAQDMGKIGFIQDLLHGIAKVAKTGKAAGTPAATPAAPAASGKNPLLRRAQLFLETGDFAKTLDFCEQVLNTEPENGEAYFLRLMAEFKLSDEAELVKADGLENNKTFKLAQRFADDALKSKLNGILKAQAEAREAERKRREAEAEAERKRQEAEAEAERRRREAEAEAERKRQEIRQASYAREQKLARAIKAEYALHGISDLYNKLAACRNAEYHLRAKQQPSPEDAMAVKAATEEVLAQVGDLTELERLAEAKRRQKQARLMKITLIAVAAAVLLPIIIVISSNAISAISKRRYLNAELAQARAAKDASRWSEVLDHTLNVLFKDPNNAEAKNLREEAWRQIEEARRREEARRQEEAYKRKAEELRKAAEQGYAAAQFNLGRCYECGKGVEKNMTEAVKWYCKAAEQGYAAAQFGLSRLAEELRKAAEQRYAEAQFNLGRCYECGKGVEKNMTEAVKWFRKAAEQGYARAQCNLGLCYDKGDGVEKNMTEAVKWFRKAAEQGYARAQCNLGLCYDKGDGVEKNMTEAVKWFRKAAEQGYARAQCNLGLCYYKGDGVEKNMTEAVKWFRKAAEQGCADAQYCLGLCYANGYGVEKNMTEAVKWFRKAAEQGYAEAQCSLGWRYYNGEGVEKNMTEAVKWWRQAAEQGNAGGQCNLGVCYAKGEGVEKNMTEAVKWWRQAAEQGYAEAQINLGVCYYNGDGVEKNMTEAVKWYRKAAEQGYAEAQRALSRLEEEQRKAEELRRAEEARRQEEARRKEEARRQKEARRKEEARRQEEARRRAEEARRREEEFQKILPGGVLRLPGGVKLELAPVKAGTFTMGSPTNEEGRHDDEVPHRVTLTRDFWLGRTEVTQAQWRAVMGNNPSYYKGDDLPVEDILWHDAMEFCRKLNEMGKAPGGWEFTLPTEAQWEYAARGGNQSRGYKYSGSDDPGKVAWYGDNSRYKTHPVATKGANELGLYDMSGNVWEWCLDWYGSCSGDATDPAGPSVGSDRVCRGGSWDYRAGHCRSANRNYCNPGNRISRLGFRLALVPVR